MIGEVHILGLILQSALRSALLGACVYAALKLFRLRDLRTETAIWTVVLLIATATPFLAAWAPGLVVRLPEWPAHGAAAAPSTHPAAATLSDHRALKLALAAYVLIAAACLVRVAVGLLLSWRLCARAEAVLEPWALGRDIRVSPDVDSPLSLAAVIVLPADYGEWSEAKLAAVLAHEESHIRRGDFFIQLLACAHRGLFWFSPFAWWLPLRLGELAETASDAAAMQHIADPAGYAEILVEVTRQARRAPRRLNAAAMAMARGPGVAKRVDHILSGVQERALGGAGRALALGLALMTSLGFAEVRAATAPNAPPLPTTPLARAAEGRLPPGAATASRATPSTSAARVSHANRQSPRDEVPPALVATPVADEVTYDPRALLEEPSVAATPGFILAGPVGRAAANGGD